MKLSKALTETLISVLKANTAESAKVLKTATDEADELGVLPSEYPLIRGLHSRDHYTSELFIFLKMGEPFTLDRYNAAVRHSEKIYAGQQQLKIKSLSVLVMPDASTQGYDHYIANGKPFIFLHNEKGLLLEKSGSIGNTAIGIAQLPFLRVATDAEIESCVKDLNSAQQTQILSHSYFTEVRNALLTS